MYTQNVHTVLDCWSWKHTTNKLIYNPFVVSTFIQVMYMKFWFPISPLPFLHFLSGSLFEGKGRGWERAIKSTMFLFDICPFLMHAYDMWCDFISSYEPTLVKSYKDYRNVVNVSSIYTLYSLKPTDTCTITHKTEKGNLDFLPFQL